FCSSRRRHTSFSRDWSSDVCSSDLDRRAAEDLPYVFIGLPSAITGPYDDVALPAWAEKPDWELELAAVIGRPAYQVSVEEALDQIGRASCRERGEESGVAGSRNKYN